MTPAAHAPTSQESRLAAALRDIGDVVRPDRSAATVALFADLHEHAPPADVSIRRDVPYGPHSRNRLDVFVSASDGPPSRPVVVFVHGGNFVGGDKSIAGSPFYDNVGIWAAQQGFVGVTMTYRLAPEVGHPAGVDDLALAVRFLRGAVGDAGGDAGRVVLVGASAGAVHVASYLASRAPGEAGVAGAALLSGMYDLAEFGDRSVLDRYYGADADLAAVSPLAGLVDSGVPLFASVAELDPPDRHRQWVLLAAAVQARSGRVPQMVYLPEHNHFSEVLHLGTADERLSLPLAHFINGLPAG